MKDKLTIIDIETAPNWDVLRELFPPREPKPFDPDEVKTGNLKDPDKIQSKVEQAELDYVKQHSNWLDKHWDGILTKKKVLLKSSLSLVCAVGTRTGLGENKIYLGADNEEAEFGLLMTLSEELDAADAVVGWNIKGFDLPYLSFRFRAQKIPVPDIIKPGGRYYKPQVIDLMEVVADYQYGNNQSLKNVAVALGFPRCPEESGAGFWKLDEAAQRHYLGWDINAVAHVMGYYPELAAQAANY